MRAPVSLIVSAFAPVSDVRRSLTPQIDMDCDESRLLLIDLGNGRNRLGGSAFAQVQGRFGSEVPDLDDPALLRDFFDAIQALNRDGLMRAYHDRSDGGVITTLCEMAFAAHCGLDLQLASAGAGHERLPVRRRTRGRGPGGRCRSAGGDGAAGGCRTVRPGA